MRRILCSLLLAGFPLLWPTAGTHAAENRDAGKKSPGKIAISDEDRQVIRKMELLQLMELLKDMDLLEGKIKVVSEDKK